MEVKSIRRELSEVRQKFSEAIGKLHEVEDFVNLAEKAALCLRCKHRIENEYCKRLKIKTSHIICLFCPERKAHVDKEKARRYISVHYA